MGLFMSKAEKKIQEKMLLNRAMNTIKKYIAELAAAKKRYIAEAVRAKQFGIPSQYRLARSGLAMVVKQQGVAEQLLLTIEMTAQMKDSAAATAQFAEGMQRLSEEINRINGRIDFVKTRKKMGKAVAAGEMAGVQLGEFLEESGSLFEGVAGTSEQSELDGLIDREAAALDSDVDGLDAEVERLKKMG